LNKVGSLNKIGHEINKFEQEHQRHPSVSELSEATNIDEEKINQSMMADGHNVSIDAPFQDGEDNCMLDVMAGGDDTRTDRHVDHESMAQELNSVLSRVLKDREIIIIRECFGIVCHEKGLEEIGDELGLTRERVRQIREKSIAKLRDSGNARILMKYLG
jgi:RNA polymerase primary sigma factor